MRYTRKEKQEIKQYDVGILTFWNVPNYGTFAQAYALEQVLTTLFPNRDVRQIAYLNKKHYDNYYNKRLPKNFLKKSFYEELKILLDSTSAYNLRKKRFPQYYQSIKHTESMNRDQLINTRFDTVILGSDIIWDYSFECFDKDPFLFGLGLNSKEIIAYATSFGTIKADAVFPNYVKKGIIGMKEISVRDNNSADIVEKITGIRPPVVLDPTWLWDFDSDINIVKPIYKDYIIVYGQDFTKKYIEELIIYAKEKNLKLVCLDCNNDHYGWCDVLIRQADLSPFEWIGLFKYAQIIATSTYHGLTFGLIFNKPIVFCATEFILSKAGDFLKELGLYDLLSVKDQSIKKMAEYEWDYKGINCIIENKKKKSINYLRKNLSYNIQ
ncbi:polysaccharide pyruvyl transferase family protein [Anaerostipes sp.]|uniref:polysaccharide pyruvyl transferase family protein n=1 Tax=Anaerostipes sp. TaxID=1872530 RepID=UPI00257C7565|nr:polysaccharide pyruvyl transferase family protein [Anaerostipes sp.]